MKNLTKKNFFFFILAGILSFTLLTCTETPTICEPTTTGSGCDNPIHLGILSNDTSSPYSGDFIWSSVANVDSFCFSFIWNGEIYVNDSIVTDTTFSFDYPFLPGDTLILCVSSYCNDTCTTPALKDTIIFSNGLAEDDIVFFVPPDGTEADVMCTTTLTCDVINFSGSTVKYDGKTIQTDNFYTNNYYWKNPFCDALQNNGDDLLKAMQTSLHGWRTSGSIPCN